MYLQAYRLALIDWPLGLSTSDYNDKNQIFSNNLLLETNQLQGET